jgi:hypothetical protein
VFIDSLLSSGCVIVKYGKNATFLGLHVKFPIFFPDIKFDVVDRFSQISPISRNPPSQIHVLIHKDERAGWRAD